jgi:hypothetical protein
MHRALVAFRTYPWSDTEVMAQAMTLARRIGESSPARAKLMFDALSKPFAVLQQQNLRRYALLRLAPLFDGCGQATIAALRDVEPHPYWGREILDLRADCYRRAGLDALADRAWRDLADYVAGAPTPVVTPPAPPAPRGSS